MAAFRFPLQPLLDFRQRAERERRHRLLEAERVYAEARNTLQTLAGELTRLSNAFASDFLELDADQLRQTFVHIDVVKSALARQVTAAASASSAADDARAGYLTAHRERKQIEALRDRAYGTFLAGEEGRDAREHDEANAARGIISP